MYAIIEHGGKQYKVCEGDQLLLDLTDLDPQASQIQIEKVLLVSYGKDVKLGTPYLDGAKVIAAFQTSAADAVVKGPKLYPTYFRRRKSSRKKIGHRQRYLKVTISKIEA